MVMTTDLCKLLPIQHCKGLSTVMVELAGVIGIVVRCICTLNSTGFLPYVVQDSHFFLRENRLFKMVRSNSSDLMAKNERKFLRVKMFLAQQ